MSKILKQALFNAIGTASYVVAVSAFMFYGEHNQIGRSNSILVPISFLLLFVFSAAITSFLVFGRPAILYFDEKKKEAISLLSYTLVFLFCFTLIAIFLLISFSNL